MKKRCTKCGRLLPVSDFYTQKAGRYGVSSICKECTENNRKLKTLELKIRKIIQAIINRKTKMVDYHEEFNNEDIEFKPHLKEDFTYSVVVSQTQNCWITVEAKSREEAVFKAYSALYNDGVYRDDDVIFDSDAKLESVELDVCPDDEDYVDIKYKEEDR